MKRLKLKLEDLSVESFASSGRPLGRGTVQARSEEMELPGGETGESCDELCAGIGFSFPTCITRECTCWRTCPIPVWGCF